MDASQLVQTHLPIVPSHLTRQLSMDVQKCLVVLSTYLQYYLYVCIYHILL
jgi:hypothetical protein